MRGILSGEWKWLDAFRFIPADAGNTAVILVARAVLSVHPRGCGEYISTAMAMQSDAGSSPRMRGIRPARIYCRQAHRFIPADAGNTLLADVQHVACAVHPRGCGEYDHEAARLEHRFGSSPRMRGIPLARQQPETGTRFIPADAGNTSCTTKVTVAAPVHPRGCGEYFIYLYAGSALGGSSPRMRGIRRIAGW